MKTIGVKRLVSILMAFCLMVSVFAACGTGTKEGDSKSTTATVTEAVTEKQKEVIDPLGKYTTPITLTTVKRTIQNVKFADGDSEENNTWTRFLKDQGIEIKYLWMADASQYDQKVAMTIASGEIPDFITQLKSNTALNMVKGNMTMDMKPYLDKYMSPLLKQYYYDFDEGQSHKALYDKDGKQMLLPMNLSESRWDANALWIRKDWLDKVGLKPPTTVDEFLAVCDAFVNKDPDGNGKNDTYAYAVAGKDNLIRDWCSLTGIFEMYHTYPFKYWDGSLFYEKDSSGKVIWSGSKPAVKDALKTLTLMYKKGYIAKDFGTADAGGKIVQDLVAGKVGMLKGEPWLALWPLPDVFEKNTDASFICIPFPSADGKPTKRPVNFPVTVFAAVSSKCKNPEAVIKIMNWSVEKKYGKDQDNTLFGADTNDAGKSANNCPIKVDDPLGFMNSLKAISEAVKAKDPSKLRADEKNNYDSIMAYLAAPKDPKNKAGWGAYLTYGTDEKNLVYSTYYLNAQQPIKNVWFNITTDNITSKEATFTKMCTETLTKIIYGTAPVEEWDKFVADWMKAGGDELLKEVEAQAK